MSYREDFAPNVCWLQVEGPTDWSGRPIMSKAWTVTTYRANYELLIGADVSVYNRQLVRTCPNISCVNPYHYTQRKRKKDKPKPKVKRTYKPTVRPCAVCKRMMRPQGVLLRDMPQTIAHASNGLCSGCFAATRYVNKADEVEPLSDEHQQVVRRKVPADLWSYFGV